jgi:hypothetical protein
MRAGLQYKAMIDLGPFKNMALQAKEVSLRGASPQKVMGGCAAGTYTHLLKMSSQTAFLHLRRFALWYEPNQWDDRIDWGALISTWRSHKEHFNPPPPHHKQKKQASGKKRDREEGAGGGGGGQQSQGMGEAAPGGTQVEKKAKTT